MNPESSSNNEMREQLAREIHGVYQEQAHAADDSRWPDDYDLLPEHTKDYDRVMVDWHLAKVNTLEATLRSERALREDLEARARHAEEQVAALRVRADSFEQRVITADAENQDLLHKYSDRNPPPGTGLARMHWVWGEIHKREDLLEKYANYSGGESTRTPEQALFESFDAATAELETTRQALRDAEADDCNHPAVTGFGKAPMHWCTVCGSVRRQNDICSPWRRPHSQRKGGQG